MLKQLEHIRLTNNIATHQYSLQHLKDKYIHPFNIILIQENGRIIRETLLTKPQLGIEIGYFNRKK